MSESQSTKKWYEPIVDWLKLNGGTLVADWLMANGGTYIKSLGLGFWGFLIGVAYKWIALPIIRHYKNQIKNEAAAKPILEAHEAIINKPEVTHEEVTASEDNFFNRP